MDSRYRQIIHVPFMAYVELDVARCLPEMIPLKLANFLGHTLATGLLSARGGVPSGILDSPLNYGNWMVDSG